jgi:hypothetical protein
VSIGDDELEMRLDLGRRAERLSEPRCGKGLHLTAREIHRSRPLFGRPAAFLQLSRSISHNISYVNLMTLLEAT